MEESALRYTGESWTYLRAVNCSKVSPAWHVKGEDHLVDKGLSSNKGEVFSLAMYRAEAINTLSSCRLRVKRLRIRTRERTTQVTTRKKI